MPRSFDALRLLRMTRVKRCCGKEIDAAVPSPSRLKPCHLSHRERQGGADVGIRPVVAISCTQRCGNYPCHSDQGAAVWRNPRIFDTLCSTAMPRSFDALRLLRMTCVKRCCGKEIDVAVPSPSRLCRATSPIGRGKVGRMWASAPLR